MQNEEGLNDLVYRNMRKPRGNDGHKPGLGTGDFFVDRSGNGSIASTKDVVVEPGKPQTYEEALWNELKDIQNMLVRKHLDYGTHNLTRFGMTGILIRISDKLARLEHLLENEALVRDESIDDTLDDLIGYALQAKLLRNGFLSLPCVNVKDDIKK